MVLVDGFFPFAQILCQKSFFCGFAPRGKTKIWLRFGPGAMAWMPKLHEFYRIQQFRIQQCEACDLTTRGS